MRIKSGTLSPIPTRLPWAAALAVAGLPAVAGAAGFQINEHNAAATGRAGAVFATVKDASAIFYNPAGLTQIEGTSFQAGLTLIRPRGSYTGPGLPSTRPAGAGETVTQDAESPFVPVPNAYVARSLSSRAFVGFGFYAPYGLGISWENPDDFVGRTVVQELSLRSFFMTPAIALKLSDQVSVAVSVSLVPATVSLTRVLGASDNGEVLFPKSLYGEEGRIDLAGSGFGVGANAGLQIKIIDELKVGLAFRSAVGIDFTGNVDFTLPESVPPSVAANFPDGEVRAEVTLPHSFAIGVAYDSGPLTVELAGNLTLWQSYEELRINFVAEKPQRSSASPRNWVAAGTVRLGGEYRISDYALRLGAAYDMTPVPDETIDPTLPDNDRVIFTAGAGGVFGPVNVDLGYMGVYVLDREANASVNFAPGTYSGGLVNLLSVTAGVTF